MADDAGIDKQRILDEIVGESALPPPAPTRAPAPPPPAREREVTGGFVPAPAPEGRLSRHRAEVAAIALVSAGLLWLAVALASGQGTPALFGAAFLLTGLSAGVRCRRSSA